MTYKPYLMKDVIDNSNKELFNVISTFAGGGGSSTGYRLAGGKILCVNEFVEAAVDTYKSNYPNTPVLPDDIKKLKGDDFLKIAGIQKGDLDILDKKNKYAIICHSGVRSHNVCFYLQNLGYLLRSWKFKRIRFRFRGHFWRYFLLFCCNLSYTVHLE